MPMLEVLTAIALVFALLAFFGPRRKARLALEAAEDQVLRYQRAVDNLDKWCGYEFPQARLIAAHLTAIGEGHGLNAGTPHADEPCTVNGLREQLRRLQSAPVATRMQVLDHMESLKTDPVVLEKLRSASQPAAQVCNYPQCNCPFDAPADPNWCARGFPQAPTPAA